MPYTGLTVALVASAILVVVTLGSVALGYTAIATGTSGLLVLVLVAAAYRHALLIRKPSEGTRKPVYKLTRRDLRTFPVWEFLYEEDKYDETYVKPVPERILYPHRQCVLAVEFVTARGVKYSGLIHLSTAKSEFRDPTVSFTETKWIDLTAPGGEIYCFPEHVERLPEAFARDTRRYRKDLEASFGAKLEDAFPIEWRLEVVPFGWEGTTGGILPRPEEQGYLPKIMTPPVG